MQLAINGGSPVIQTKQAHFKWPRVTNATKQAVLNQMETSISIYDQSGIFANFEEQFAYYHSKQHALLANSGTSAIFSMFEGIGVQAGDEVICPAYTFFATISPLMYLGGVPVFCDALRDGNISPQEIANRITAKTKAVIITHMWGIPCKMDEIVAICKEKDVFLLEDCSHAHEASYQGKKIGSFGDAAAWSLQGQKIISGGEGGILVTDNEEILYRALSQGHYNKRCKQQIPKDHPLHKFALTGFGQKFRAHPFAIAMAQEQFQHLDQWINQKNIFAQQVSEALSGFEFISIPQSDEGIPSWYAYTFQFEAKKACGVTLNQFVNALQAEGLCYLFNNRTEQDVVQ